MPESAEELYRRALAAADADGRLPIPPLEEWETFPFEGEIRTRPLRPPADDPPRQGEGGIDCWRCAQGDSDAIWSDDHWLVAPLPQSSGLPVIVILYPREHFDFDGLPPALQAELGPLLVRVERAVDSVGGIGRVGRRVEILDGRVRAHGAEDPPRHRVEERARELRVRPAGETLLVAPLYRGPAGALQHRVLQDVPHVGRGAVEVDAVEREPGGGVGLRAAPVAPLEALAAVPGVVDVQAFGDRAHARLDEIDQDEGIARVKSRLEAQGIKVLSARPVAASLEDVFLELIAEK